MTELQVVDLGNFPVDEATPVVSGPRGQDGTDGASAYEVAVANGFVGTEAEWLASLKGADGIGGGGGGAVDSVNGQVGAVILDAADVGARPDTYVPTWAEVTGKPAIPDSADDIGAETPAGAQAKVDTHAADTTAVHGIADTAALATTADVSAASTADRARANHTGTQSADTLTDGTTNKAFLATERTKLAGVATGATANDTDANLKSRANHTGTQAASTITGLGDAAAKNTGTAAGTVAAGDDSRITGAAQKSANLSDLANSGTARTNLGLGTTATKNTGTASGDVPLLTTGGRLAIAQIASGTPDGTKFVRDDGTLAVPAGGGSSGGILASVIYNPATDVTYNTTSTTMVDLDATNLAITFTAPASGSVRVTLSALASMNATGSIMYWGIRSGSTLVTDSSLEMYFNTTLPFRLTGQTKIDGLTPGNSYTWKWAWMRASGTATLGLSTGKQAAASPGPATMTVEAA